MKASASNTKEAYESYGPALVRKAHRVLRNEADAMDVVQTLFLDLLSKPPQSLELAYLYTAVTNRCLNILRNQNNRTRLLETRVDSERTCIRTAVLSMNLITQMVDKLDAKSSQIFVYHFVDDLNQEEVAVQMSMSRRSVVKRLSKIRILANQLARAASEGDGIAQEVAS